MIRSRFPENVGKVVKLVNFIGKINDHDMPGIYWEIEAITELTGYITTEVSCRVKPGSRSMAISKCLMPIDGNEFSNEDERQKELTHG